jgi:hypothetical protein
MLLIGMKTSFTKKPIKPITANPTAQAPAILMYSKCVLPLLSGFEQRFISLLLSPAKSFKSLIVELTMFCFSDIFYIITPRICSRSYPK